MTSGDPSCWPVPATWPTRWGQVALILTLLWAGRVRASDEPTRVVLVNDPADTSIGPRLSAELRGLGLDLTEVAKNEVEVLPRDLVEAARRTGAVLGFRVVVSAGQVDVWLADRLTGKVVLRELLPRDAGNLEARVVALRAVELLRVSLMEMDAPHAPQGEVSAPAAVVQTTALLETWQRYSLGLASSVLWSPGGANPGVGAAASLAWHPGAWGARLVAGSVLAPARLSGPEGSGEITTRWAGLEAILQPRSNWGRWRPRLGVGLALLSTTLHGVALAPRPTSQSSLFTVAPSASAELGWSLHRNLRLGVSLSYLRPLRSAVVIFDRREAGQYGAHLLVAQLGLNIVL